MPAFLVGEDPRIMRLLTTMPLANGRLPGKPFTLDQRRPFHRSANDGPWSSELPNTQTLPGDEPAMLLTRTSLYCLGSRTVSQALPFQRWTSETGDLPSALEYCPIAHTS
jgi:hypothetical protein